MNLDEVYYCSRCMRQLDEEGVCPYCGYDPTESTGHTALEEGTLLCDGRYQLGAVIGEGGFGITYAAWDHVLQTPAAIKEYFPKGYANRDTSLDDTLHSTNGNGQIFQKGLRRFHREARILAALQNVKHVVTVRDCFEDNGTAYIVMEFVQGITLDHYIRQQNIPPNELLEMVRDVIDALATIHRQDVLHRDISPGNLLVLEDGSVKLIDFGAAVRLSVQAQGEDRTVMLNKRYAAVEQYDERGKQGPWTDVYGLCATLYSLLTGNAPPEAVLRQPHDTLRPLWDYDLALSRQQEQAIMDGLIISPEQRTQSMEELSAGLYGGQPPAPRWPVLLRRYRKPLGAALAAALVLCASLALWALAPEPSSPAAQDPGSDAPPSPIQAETEEPGAGEEASEWQGETEPEETPETGAEEHLSASLQPFTTVGNSPGNLQNAGIAVDCDGRVFYSYPNGVISYEDPEFGIQHTGITGYSLNYLDGMLYYRNGDYKLCRTSLDTFSEEVLLDEPCNALFATDTGLYYTQNNDPDDSTAGLSLYCLDRQGASHLVFSDCDAYSNLLLWDGQIYYSGSQGFSCAQADGSDAQVISQDAVFNAALEDGWIYYGAASEIRRMCTDGTGDELFLSLDGSNLSGLNVADGWLYYSVYRGVGEPAEVWQMPTDGGEPELIWTGGGEDGRYMALNLCIVNDTLYFHLYNTYGSSSFEFVPLGHTD